MTPEQQARLFHSFSQADSSTTRKYGGSGLGLAIVHRIVTDYQGVVKVDSTPAVGTTVSVRLPARVEATTT